MTTPELPPISDVARIDALEELTLVLSTASGHR